MRKLAHDYRREIRQARPAIEPIVAGWRDVFSILGQCAVLLFCSIAFGAMLYALAAKGV